MKLSAIALLDFADKNQNEVQSEFKEKINQ